MKTRMFWTFALASCLIACGKQPPADEAPVEPAAEEPVVAAEPAPAEPVPVESAADEPAFDQEFLDHMHAHAERVDELMYALDDGDLDGAKAAAYWLSRHKTVDGIPDECQVGGNYEYRIDDGGNDMYDKGNYLNSNFPATNIPYTTQSPR